MLNHTNSVAQTDNGEYDYSDIELIMVEKCNTCHGRGEQGFNSSSYQGIINSISPPTSYDGPYVIPFEAANSPLVDKILPDPEVGQQMPLREEPLSEEEVSIIRDWIDQGAKESLSTSIGEEQDIPFVLRLNSNYPNPFNPSTTVSFDTPMAGTYTLPIYNVAGRFIGEVAGRTGAGSKQVRITLDGQPSGVYFYRLTLRAVTGEFLSADSKMTLLR